MDPEKLFWWNLDLNFTYEKEILQTKRTIIAYTEWWWDLGKLNEQKRVCKKIAYTKMTENIR